MSPSNNYTVQKSPGLNVYFNKTCMIKLDYILIFFYRAMKLKNLT